jgi:hypothetical protein
LARASPSPPPCSARSSSHRSPQPSPLGRRARVQSHRASNSRARSLRDTPAFVAHALWDGRDVDGYESLGIWQTLVIEWRGAFSTGF